MADNFIDVGPLEMKVLGLLDGQAPMSVGSIQVALKKIGNDLAYTTVMTVLVRLFNKNYIKREKEGRQYFYYCLSQKKSATQKLFNKVKQSLFQNHRLKPILSLLDSDENLTADELKELQKIIDKRLQKFKKR